MNRLTLLVASLALCGLACSATPTPEDARRELGILNVKFSDSSFVERAKDGDTTAVKLFLTAGMNPDSRGSTGQLAYMLSSTSKSDGVAFLIGYEEALNQISIDNTPNRANGSTALMAAAINDRAETVSLLIKAHAKVDLTDRVGMTALTYAAWHGQSRVVKLLLEAGADPRYEVEKLKMDVAAIAAKSDSSETQSLLAAAQERP